MNSNIKIGFLGGDLRQIRAANLLSLEHMTVKISGFGKNNNIELMPKIEVCDSYIDLVHEADIIVLPLPFNLSDDILNAPLCSETIYINDLMKSMKVGQILLAGKTDEKIKNLAHIYSIHLIDYFEREELTVLNAVPTAEGALAIAMNEIPVTIHGSRCLVLGFGRIGKILSRMLYSLGAETSVAARQYADIAWIRANNLKPMNYNNLVDEIGKYDVIFNTVPHLILDEKVLTNVSRESLIIDLASKPGGVEFDAAKNLGLKVIWALSLPGKVAPLTAGEIIKDTILNIINELGV